MQNQNAIQRAGRAVRLPRQKVLYGEGDRPASLYFVQSGLASIIVDMPEGEQVEVAMVGCEGVIGLPFLFGALDSASRCVVQVEATAFSVPMNLVSDLMREQQDVRHRLLEWLQAYLFATQRVAACNRVHHATQRLVRWLLTSELHARTLRFPYTHELLAQMTAVQRTTVSSVLNHLQSERLLDHGWGTVTLLDLEGLEQRACSCFPAIRSYYASLYNSPLPFAPTVPVR